MRKYGNKYFWPFRYWAQEIRKQGNKSCQITQPWFHFFQAENFWRSYESKIQLWNLQKFFVYINDGLLPITGLFEIFHIRYKTQNKILNFLRLMKNFKRNALQILFRLFKYIVEKFNKQFRGKRRSSLCPAEILLARQVW